MQAAIWAMDREAEDGASIEKCWFFSEESEWLADYVKENPTRYIRLLTKLTQSQYPIIRWQAYSCLEFAGATGIQILEKGINDLDAYVRRRAVLALAKVSSGSVLARIDELCRDTDIDNQRILSRLKSELLKAARR